MNFNLISPDDNGHTFNVRFNEPIVIPENASCHLNWATFERTNRFKFNENQTVKVLVKEILPYYDWNNDGVGKVDGAYRVNGLDRSGADLVLTIPKGTYFVNEIQDKISTFFHNMAGDSTADRTGVAEAGDSTHSPTNKSLKCLLYSAVIPSNELKPNYLEMGIINDYPLTNIEAHSNHYHQIAQVGGAPFYKGTVKGTAFKDATDATIKVPDTGSYSGYLLAKDRYLHTGGEFAQYSSGNTNCKEIDDGGFDELEYVNTMILKTGEKWGDQVGNIFMGIYNEGVAGVVADTTSFVLPVDANNPLTGRTNLANIKTYSEPVTEGEVPDAIFGVEICGSDAGANQHIMNFYSGIPALQSTGNTGMSYLGEYDLSANRNPKNVNPVTVGIQTYFDKGNVSGDSHMGQKGDLHIRVFVGDNAGGKQIVFDTNSQIPTVDSIVEAGIISKNYLRQFNVPATATADNLAQAKASQPFSPILYFTDNTDKAYIQYSSVEDIVDGDKTNSSLLEYEVEISKELGNMLVDTDTSVTTDMKNASLISYTGAIADIRINKNVNPKRIGMAENPWFVRNNKLQPQFLNEKLSIYLPDLPIKSYKNNGDKNKSGYRKSILANVPTPFGGMIDYDGKSKVIGGYTASLGVVNRLSNQSMTTNNFSVEIRDLESDEPASELQKTTLNFTISAE